MKRLLFIFATLLITWLTASAYDFKVDGIAYKKNGDGKSVSVTYTTSQIPTSSTHSSYAGSVVIPSVVKYNGTTYIVSSIGGSAFEYCSGLTSITLPDSLKTIGNYAFNGCSGLTSITIPNSVTDIGYRAFGDCSGLTGSLTIPKSVTTIGTDAFINCSGLTGSLFIPNTVTNIGKEAFGQTRFSQIIVDESNKTYDSRDNSNTIIETSTNTLMLGCKNSIIPNSVTSIGDYAFYRCKDITGSLIIPNSVTNIGNAAFYSCSGLTSLTIHSSVTSIGERAFEYCSGLKSVNIGKSISTIGDYAFYDIYSKAAFSICATTPPKISSNTFKTKHNIYIPFQFYSNYANANYWKSQTLLKDGAEMIMIGTQQGPGGFGGSGSGTENDPYLIFNPIQLYNVRNFTGYTDVYFKLMADIDLSEFIADNSPIDGWEPIGSQASPFMGNFDGSNHTISGISINRNSNFVGFFSCLNGAKISNLTIKGTTIKGLGRVGSFAGLSQLSQINNVSASFNGVSGSEYVGGFIGTSQVDDNVTSCGYIGDVNCTGNYAGGFVALSMTQNTTSCTVTSQSIQGQKYTGGFAGWSYYDTITGCVTRSTKLSGTQYTGGAIGYAEEINIKDSYSIVNDLNGGEYTGGFAGIFDSYDDIANGCGAIANVNGKTPVGGFVGNNFGSIDNIFAVGNIASEQGSQLSGTGGIAGICNNFASITNGYYSGNISANNNCVGGIVGSANTATICKNYSIGTINGLQYVGGIVGESNSSVTIKSNVAAGEVVNAVNGDVGRIYGVIASGSPVIGSNGTADANRGLTTMRIVSQGLQITPTDGEQSGTSIGKSMLKYKTTYQGLNWDFINDWTILDTESYPYKPSQCAPPVINGKQLAGDTSIGGNCVNGASVYVIVEGKKYTATVSGNTWTAAVDPLPSGATIKVYATVGDKIQSYFVTSVVGYAGAGTEEDPYLIYTASDLANINSYSYYKVMNDIDLTDYIASHDAIAGWKPIGFTGGGTMKQLDGNGKTISGLWFNHSSQNCGLVSSIENATIKDLTIKVATGKSCTGENCSGIVVGKATGSVLTNITAAGTVEGQEYVGGIAGKADNTSISQCSVKNATVNGTNHIGGIAGYVSAMVSDAVVKSTTINATGNYVGGIAGELTADITLSMADVTLTGKDYIGGLVGETSANITLCTSTGTAESSDMENSHAGGIAGAASGNIVNCYSSVKTTGGLYAGGIVGYTYGEVKNCYSNGDIAATNFGAGIAGYLDGANAAVNHCFAINNRIDVSDQTGVAMRVIGGLKNGAATPAATNFANKAMVVSVNNVTQTIYDDVLEGKGVQLATLMQQATYAAQGWDFNETWSIKEGKGFPYLQWVSVEEEPEYITGDANGDGFVRINDVVTTSNYILGDEPAGFVFAAADVNQDGFVRINDVVLIANIILDGGNNAPAKVAAMPLSGNDYMAAQGVDIKAGETRFIDIELNNDNAFSALQMDINLPDGLVLKGATLTGRADGHNLMVGRTVNGKATIAAFSTESSNFAGNNGAVIRLEVMATGNVNEDIKLDNIFASTAKGELKQLEAVSVGVNAVTGINDITVNNGPVNVYNVAGQLIRRNVNASEATHNLPAGLYLVGGKKVVVK